jgi:hypothetical protein
MEERPVRGRAERGGGLLGSDFSREDESLSGEAWPHRQSRPVDRAVCGASGCRSGERLTEVVRVDGETRVLCVECALGWMRR